MGAKFLTLNWWSTVGYIKLVTPIASNFTWKFSIQRKHPLYCSWLFSFDEPFEEHKIRVSRVHNLKQKVIFLNTSIKWHYWHTIFSDLTRLNTSRHNEILPKHSKCTGSCPKAVRIGKIRFNFIGNEYHANRSIRILISSNASVTRWPSSKKMNIIIKP